jgi:hypothetical protein
MVDASLLGSLFFSAVDCCMRIIPLSYPLNRKVASKGLLKGNVHGGGRRAVDACFLSDIWQWALDDFFCNILIS